MTAPGGPCPDGTCLADAWAQGVSIPSPRSPGDGELAPRQEGVEMPREPSREPWTFVDYLAAVSRAVDRQICKGIRWARQPGPRRRGRHDKRRRR
jgi:hypothetical protein